MRDPSDVSCAQDSNDGTVGRVPSLDPPCGALTGVPLDAVDAYLGIPYAEPPVGPLRFRPPVPLERWHGVRDATSFGPAAPQPVGGRFSGLVPGMAAGPQSEDCLTLNVWAPRTAGAPKPVLVWLHGGAFTIGATSLPVYDGQLLASEQDVVVVSVGYRLGALGWLHGPPGVTPNCGLLDQLEALRWVRTNVAWFGGDPGNVTVFGESAGAGSVLHLMASPHARGLLHKAIAQSPGAAQTLTPDRAALVGDALVAAVGGRELAEVPVAELLAAQQQVADQLVRTVGAMAFHPVVDGDTVPAAPLEPGAPAAVPLLAGTTAEEMRLFADPLLAGLDHATLVSVLEPLLSAEAHRPVGAAAVDAVLTAYEQALPGSDGADLFAAVTTDAVMRLPVEQLLDQHATVAPTYAYSFTWRATGAPRDVGACHGADIPFAFGTLDRDGWADWLGDRDDAQALSRAVREAWATFARTGRPAAKDLPDWPAYDANRLTVLLGRTVEVAADPLREARSRCAPLQREPVPPATTLEEHR
jgi:para-nitrobenzyl esterase